VPVLIDRLRRHSRLLVLVAILCALVPGLFVGLGGSAGHSVPGVPAGQQSVTAAELGALHHMAAPAGFQRYRRWSLSRGATNAAVSCVSRVGLCFGRDAVLAPFTPVTVRALVGRFGVRVSRTACSTVFASCTVQGSFSGYALTALVNVIHSHFRDERAGTQVIFFAEPS
jgi:hypothetical protein